VAARDITVRIESATRRERRVAREAALSRAMTLALEPTDAATFLSATLAALLSQPPWSEQVVGAAVFLTDAAEERGSLVPAAASGLDAAQNGVAGVLAQECADRVRRLGPDASGNPCGGMAVMGTPAVGYACAPVVAHARLLGVFTLAAAPGFTDADEEAVFLGRIAEVLALGLNQRRLMAEAETARRRAEDTLAELRTYQDALHAHAIISETDPSGVITKVNENFCAVTGFSEAELLGRTHRLVSSGAHSRTFFADLWQRIASGESWRGDICDRAKSGELAWFDTTIFPVCDAQGAIRRYVALRFDISARVAMGEALARANAELDEVAEIAGAGGWSQLVGGSEMRWDARIRQIFEAPSDFAPTGTNTAPLFARDALPVVEACIERAVSNAESFDIELPAHTLRGRPIWIRVIGRPVIENGRVSRIAGVVQDVTERKSREMRSQRLQQRIEAIFTHTDAVIFLKDRAGQFLFGNPKFLAELGVPEIRGLTDYDLMPHAEADALAAVERRIFETGEPMAGEETIVRPNGDILAFSSSKFLIPDPETGDVVLCAIATDISDRKRREREVERLRERFQTVFDNADSAIFLKRRDGTFITGNRKFLSYSGLTDAAMLDGLRNPDLFTPDLAERFTRSDLLAFETGTLQRQEEETVGPDGRRRHFFTSKFLVPDVESGDWVLCGSATEVTDQREREIENQRLRARFEAVFETSDAAISLRTRDNRVVAANRKMLSVFGGDKGLTREYLSPEAKRLVAEAAQRIFATGEAEKSEETYHTTDETDRTFLVSRALIADPLVGEDLLLTHATDITEQKALQAVAEASRREAERANAAKSAFLATMSHEIRTPLNGVIGMAALLEREVVSDRSRGMVQVIHQSGESLLTLLNDILDFSKIDSGKMVLELQPFDAGSVARRVADVHELKAREKGLAFSVRVDGDAQGPWIGDAHRVQQMLHNLVHNAVKFTERGSVSLHVRVSAEEPDSPSMLRFDVADTGIGMSADEVSRVFDEFSQADASTTRRFGGTGLGLSIARGIAEAMGGRITVRTEPGDGAIFSLSLPLARPSGPVAAPGAHAASQLWRAH
jgi:PAS domain S-box-containing protein